MKIIRNKIIPFGGKKCINLFGVLFVKEKVQLSEVDMNHEAIHSEEMKDLLWIGFYLWYIIEWVVRLVQYRDCNKAYKNISFEREAYANQGNMDYIATRKWGSWMDYLKEKKED